MTLRSLFCNAKMSEKHAGIEKKELISSEAYDSDGSDNFEPARLLLVHDSHRSLRCWCFSSITLPSVFAWVCFVYSQKSFVFVCFHILFVALQHLVRDWLFMSHSRSTGRSTEMPLFVKMGRIHKPDLTQPQTTAATFTLTLFLQRFFSVSSGSIYSPSKYFQVCIVLLETLSMSERTHRERLSSITTDLKVSWPVLLCNNTTERSKDRHRHWRRCG